jgi:hypothetical protein
MQALRLVERKESGPIPIPAGAEQGDWGWELVSVDSGKAYFKQRRDKYSLLYMYDGKAHPDAPKCA